MNPNFEELFKDSTVMKTCINMYINTLLEQVDKLTKELAASEKRVNELEEEYVFPKGGAINQFYDEN